MTEVSMFPKLESENEFTKVFKYNDIDLYLSKAFDEDSDTHFLVGNIPDIPQYKVQRVQFPIQFDTAEQRDEEFKKFDSQSAKSFIEGILQQIKTQKEKIQE